MSAIRKDQTMVRKDVTVVREEVKALTVMMQLPRSMGYDLNNAVLLIDAYGEESVLPMPNCASPDVRMFYLALSSIGLPVEDSNFMKP